MLDRTSKKLLRVAVGRQASRVEFGNLRQAFDLKNKSCLTTTPSNKGHPRCELSRADTGPSCTQRRRKRVAKTMPAAQAHSVRARGRPPFPGAALPECSRQNDPQRW